MGTIQLSVDIRENPWLNFWLRPKVHPWLKTLIILFTQIDIEPKRINNLLKRFLLIFALIGCAESAAVAQQASSPRPILRVRLEPKGVVIVGQPVTLSVDVLVPTWFTRAPVYPALEIPGAITVLSDSRPVNLSERIAGDSWAGMTRNYIIYPQEPREYTLPPAEVLIVYALEGGKSSPPVGVKFPRRTFEATIPDEMAGLDYFIATSRLRLREKFDRKIENLKVGDTIQRTITITADNTLAMFLPPVAFGTFDGLAVYAQPPHTIDEKQQRSDFLRGKRVESVTYLIQEQGNYELPGIEIFWWDLNARRLRKSTLAPIVFKAAPNPDALAELPPVLETAAEEATLQRKKSPLDLLKEWAVPGLVAGIVLFFTVRFGSRWAGRVGVWREERRKIKTESEAAYFEKFHKACLSDDEADAMRSLISWLDRIAPDRRAPLQLLFEAGDTELTQGVRQLEARLFANAGNGSHGDAGSGKKLYQAVARFRKNSDFTKSTGKTRQALLPDLNPGTK